MSDTTLDSEEPLETVDQDVDDEDYGEAGDFEGIDEDIIVADEMTIEDFLILEAVEFDSKDTEYIEWQSELTLAPFPIDSVADLKKLISKHPSFWVSAKLPSFLKDHIISTLKLTAPAPPPVVEEKPKSKFFVQRPRRSTTVSSMVLDILGDDSSKHIKSEIASIMRQGRPDLSDGADNLDMDRIGFTIKDDEILSDKPQHIEMKYGSSLLEEEVIWMDRVLELSQRRHYYTVARLYLSKMGQTNWEYSGLVGGCCIVTESNLQMISAHYIRIVDLEAWNPNRSLMFEIELYPNFKYTKATPFFHTFEITDYVAGLSFPDEAEAEEFFLKVSLCCSIPAKKMIEEEWASKEQSFCRVGDSRINVSHGLSKEVREKYADGGITDGTEVGWKKPAVPVELRGLVGPPVDTPAETDGVIDLFSPNFKRPEINRRQSLQLGASPTLFSEGNQQIADGISMAWRKNTKSLTEDEEKPVDTLQAELEAIQNRMNRLQEMRKVAKQTGDRQMAEQFKRQVTDLRHQYRQMSSQRNGERRKTFLSFTGKKKT